MFKIAEQVVTRRKGDILSEGLMSKAARDLRLETLHCRCVPQVWAPAL